MLYWSLGLEFPRNSNIGQCDIVVLVWVVVVVHSYCIYSCKSMTGSYTLWLWVSQFDGGAPTYYPSSLLTKDKVKQSNVTYSNVKAGSLGLHALPLRELFNIHDREEFHHCVVSYIHNWQLWQQCPLPPACFPAHFIPHLFPVLLQLVFRPDAVAEEMLLCLANCPTASPGLAILQ